MLKNKSKYVSMYSYLSFWKTINFIIGSKRYIVSHEGDQNIIKWMRIEKVEQMQKPLGNIKFHTF